MERKIQRLYHQRTANSCKFCCLSYKVNHRTVWSSVSHHHKTDHNTLSGLKCQAVPLDLIYSHFTISQMNRAAGTEQDKAWILPETHFCSIQFNNLNLVWKNKLTKNPRTLCFWIKRKSEYLREKKWKNWIKDRIINNVL